MQIETKFLRLFKPAAIGDRIDGWRVCWVGGWDKCRVLFVVYLSEKALAEYWRTSVVSRPLVIAACKHRPERIVASSQGSLPMLAIRPIVRRTLAALPWDHWLRNCMRLFQES